MLKYEVPAHKDWLANLQKAKLSTGIEMAYMEMGSTDAPPLIIAHGFSDTSRSTRALSLTLAEHFHVFALDERGHGQSDKPEQFAYMPIQLGADILALADYLGLDRFYLCGQSMGSMAAQSAAFTQPGRIIRLALLSTMCRFKNSAEELEAQRRNFRRYATNPPTLEEELPTAGSFADQEFGSYFYPEMRTWPMHARLAAWYGMQLTDNRRFLQYIDAPTIVFWGEHDDIVLPEWREEFRACMPDAEYVELPGCSHEIQQEKPAEIAARLVKFMLGESK